MLSNGTISIKHPILLTVVIPFNNYDRGARQMLEEVSGTVAPLVDDYELIVVDNGSSDADFASYMPLLDDAGLANIQIYRLIQAVGNEVAGWAGVECSLGDYVLVHDPRSENLSRLPEALEAIAGSCEIVFLRNTATTDFGMVQRLAGPAFRLLFRRLTGIDLARDAALGRLMSKRVVSFLLMQPNPTAQYRTLPARSGFARTTLTYLGDKPVMARRGLFARVRSALQLVVTTSMVPLRLASFATLIGALLNLFYSIYVVLIGLFKQDVAPGWVTLSLQQSGMFFLLSAILFVLTEYAIQAIRWNVSGPGYFVGSEKTSAVLSRRERLNVEGAGFDSGHPRA